MTTSMERVTPISYRSGTFEVRSSNGHDTYVVNQSCTCPGFRYRRHCKR
jgi:hypothetical protein